MLVDTGAGITIISPQVLESLGYSARDGEGRTVLRSAVAEEPGYLIRVAQLQSLGFAFDEFRIHAHDLPEGFDLDGLLGWDVLRRFNIEFRPGDGVIVASPVAAQE